MVRVMSETEEENWTKRTSIKKSYIRTHEQNSLFCHLYCSFLLLLLQQVLAVYSSLLCLSLFLSLTFFSASSCIFCPLDERNSNIQVTWLFPLPFYSHCLDTGMNCYFDSLSLSLFPSHTYKWTRTGLRT